MKNIRILDIKVSVFWWLFLVLQSITVICQIGIIFSPRWVEMDDSEVQFKGSARTIEKASGLLERWEGSEYSSIAADWCEEDSEFFVAACTLFSGLALCGQCFVIYEFCSFIYFMINILGFGLFMCGTDVLWLSLGTGFCGNIHHFTAFILYYTRNKLTFQQTCNEFRDGDEPNELCVREGLYLAFCLGFFMFVCVTMQILCIMKYYSIKKKQEYDIRAIQSVIDTTRVYSLRYPKAVELVNG